MHIGYMRESTIEQELSPLAQRQQIMAAAAREGATIDVWAEDPATSGKTDFDKREGGKQVVRLAKKGDTIWFSKLDRGFRSLADFAKMLDRWERLGINARFCDIQGQFDISTPTGKAFLQILGVFAEMERKLISIRTREALAHAKKRNHAVGKYAGYGFKWEKQYDSKRGKRVKVRVPDVQKRGVMGQIAAWRLAGHDFDAITGHLAANDVRIADGKLWSVDRVKRAFKAELLLQTQDNPKGPVRPCSATSP